MPNIVRVRYQPRVPQETLLVHVQRNLARDLPRLQPRLAHAGVLAVAAGGPSLNASIEALRAQQAAGGRVLAVNEVAHTLVRHGIRPWAAAYVGPVDLTVKSIGVPIEGVTYFMASTCPPEAFKRLRERAVVLWHPDLGDVSGQVSSDAVTGPLVAGGATVGLLSLSLACILGYREIHFYGADSSYDPHGTMHAYRSVSDAIAHGTLAVRCGEREFSTTPELLGQALAFPQLRRDLAAAGANVVVHGDGLLPYREVLRQRAGIEPPILIEPRPSLTRCPDGVVEIDAQMF